MLTSATRDDVLLVYYSGHGITADNGSLLLCARNSRTDRRLATTLGAETITRMIDQNAAATTIIILDCCHAGAFKNADVAAELAGRGRYVLAATRSPDRARDAEHGTGFSRFTAHLLRGLLGAAARPGSAYVTVSDLYRFVRRSMADEGPLVPQRRFYGDGDPPLARTGARTDAHRPPDGISAGAIASRDEITAGAIASPDDISAVAAVSPAGTGAPERDRRPLPVAGTPPPRRGRRLTLMLAAALTVAAGAGVVLTRTGLPGWALDSRTGGSARTSAVPSVPGPGIGTALPAATSAPASRPASMPASPAPRKRRAAPRPAVTSSPDFTIKAAAISTGTIASPEDGAKVKNCAYFSGTSRLAEGKTPILAMRNLNNDGTKYVEEVFGWDKPGQLSSWRGAQYFNGDAGQRYSVELMVVDLDAVRATPDRPAADALAAKGTTLAVREVTREAGDVGNDCPGPE